MSGDEADPPEGGRSSIYFVACIGPEGPIAIKIGFARDVAARLSNMQSGNPYPLRVLCSVPVQADSVTLWESGLHRKFSHARIRGEWFRPVPELTDLVAAIVEEQRRWWDDLWKSAPSQNQNEQDDALPKPARRQRKPRAANDERAAAVRSRRGEFVWRGKIRRSA